MSDQATLFASLLGHTLVAVDDVPGDGRLVVLRWHRAGRAQDRYLLVRQVTVGGWDVDELRVGCDVLKRVELARWKTTTGGDAA